jgi:beta-glucosidase
MDIDKLISEMTLEEKASLCSGEDFWHTKSIERLGIPSIMMSDGPNGLRKQEEKADHLGKQDSIEAVCYPTGSAVASSFDCSLVHEMGEALGEECRAENVDVILGPAVNIKRSPLCGRNFEYYSEDPLVAGEVAASFIDGVQSRGVGTSIKHFLVNSQEYRRMTSSSNIDERTLREIYLPAFERAVKKSQPWTVMSSYNRVNGEYASESYHYPHRNFA